jgi:hypothetical protein
MLNRNVNGVLKDWKTIAGNLKKQQQTGHPQHPGQKSGGPRQTPDAAPSRNLFGLTIEQAPQQTLRFVQNCCAWIEGEQCAL